MYGDSIAAVVALGPLADVGAQLCNARDRHAALSLRQHLGVFRVSMKWEDGFTDNEVFFLRSRCISIASQLQVSHL